MATPKNAPETVGVPMSGIIQRVEQYRPSILANESIDCSQFLEEAHLTPKIEKIALRCRRQVVREGLRAEKYFLHSSFVLLHDEDRQAWRLSGKDRAATSRLDCS